jgi:hypothetical protein
MANWPNSARSTGDGFYYKVATDADEILVGNQESDIDRNYRGSKDHTHYFKEDGKWYVRTTVGNVRQEIYAKYGGSNNRTGGYGNSLYGTTGASVDEGVSSWLDSLLD